jgi:hypothetical protein
LAQDQIEQFHCRFIVWKMTSGSNRAAQFGVKRLDGVRRVNDPANRGGKGKKRNDMLPVSPPTLRDGRIFLTPGRSVKLTEGLFAGVGIFRPIDFLQFGGDEFAVLP